MPAAIRWIDFPQGLAADNIAVHGLYWFDPADGDLGRLPPHDLRGEDPQYWHRSRCPCGGRLRFRSNTSVVQLHVEPLDPLLSVDSRMAPTLANFRNMSQFGNRGIDVYVDGSYWDTELVDGHPHDMTLFSQPENAPAERGITIYLPAYQSLRILRVGVDATASISRPSPFGRAKPVVFYGSSNCQGAGISRPGMTYSAVCSRVLNVDFINLGFGGSGKAQPAVVEFINKIDASCFVFDVGRSFADAARDELYKEMLQGIRGSHPGVPLVCVVPIYIPAEEHDPKWQPNTIKVRGIVRDAFAELSPGDPDLYLVESRDLMTPQDSDGSHESVHPNDLGYNLIGRRLAEILRPLL